MAKYIEKLDDVLESGTYNIFNNTTEYPNTFKRQGAFPLEAYSVFSSLDAAEEYAANNAIAYVGQIITVVETVTVDETVTETVNAYVIISTSGALMKLASTTASGDLTADILALQTAVGNLQTEVNEIDNGLDSIKSEIGTKGTNAVSYQTLWDAIEAILVKNASQDEAISKKLESISAEDKSINVDASDSLNPKVKVNLSSKEDNTLVLDSTGLYVAPVTQVEVPEYTMVKLDSAEEGFSSSYSLQKDGNNVGALINIPKDMVVSSGKIEVNPEGQPEGTYLVLTIANATSDKIYINVADFLDEKPVEGKTGTAINVNVDGSTGKYVVSAELNNESVTADHIVSNAVNTKHLADLSVTNDKLDSNLKESIERANSALLEHQKVSAESGTDKGTIKLTVGEVATDNVKVTGLDEAAYKTVVSNGNEDTSGLMTENAVNNLLYITRIDNAN